MLTTGKHPMRCNIDLDWCTYVCPCGCELCTRHETEKSIRDFLRDHKKHTNRKVLEHTTENGMMAWGNQIILDVILPYPKVD